MDYPISTIEQASIGYAHSATGASLYAMLWNTRGQVWNRSLLRWESYDVLERAYYAIVLAEQGASRFYVSELDDEFERIFYGEFSPALASFCHTRRVNIEIYDKAGATFSDSDTNLSHIELWLEWVPGVTDPARCAVARPRSILREGVSFADGSIRLEAFDSTIPDLGLSDNAIQFFRTAQRL